MDTDAIDLKYAREAADYIGAEHTEIIMTKEDVLSSLETVIEALATYDITVSYTHLFSIINSAGGRRDGDESGTDAAGALRSGI